MKDIVSDRTFRTVLYDFDGTLADTTELVMECYRLTMMEHLGEVPPVEEWLRGFGTPLEVQMNRFAGDPIQCEAMIASYRLHQEEHAERFIRPFDGVLETLSRLRELDLALAIVTSRHRESTLRALDLCGITDYFPLIVSPEDVSSPKPHPEPVLFALDRLGSTAGETIFIGDSPHDIAAGREAGTATAAALWGPFTRAVLEAERPDHLLSYPADVLRLVGDEPAGSRSVSASSA